jgi:hypothetical protein
MFPKTNGNNDNDDYFKTNDKLTMSFGQNESLILSTEYTNIKKESSKVLINKHLSTSNSREVCKILIF